MIVRTESRDCKKYAVLAVGSLYHTSNTTNCVHQLCPCVIGTVKLLDLFGIQLIQLMCDPHPLEGNN